jgi:Zn-dependent peptidase ImmA (M78 family)
MIRRNYAERLAEEVVRRHGPSAPPVDPTKIAESLGARVVKEKAQRGEKAGLVARKGTSIVIGVNAADAPARQRFTIAHEIGHMLLHANEPLIVDERGYALIGELRAGEESSPREIEANSFAAALLMPADWVRDALRESIDFSDDDGIAPLARRFNVSQQAMMYRLVNLGLLQNF